jgi:hypothetical protein
MRVWTGLKRRLVGSAKHDNQLSDGFLDQLSDYKLLEGSVPLSYLRNTFPYSRTLQI